MGTKAEGLGCPNCGCRHSEVTNTYNQTYVFRGKEYHKTRRRRICRHCGLPYYSNEEVEAETPVTAIPPPSPIKVPAKLDNPYLSTSIKTKKAKD